jgi:hypothetical protein
MVHVGMRFAFGLLGERSSYIRKEHVFMLTRDHLQARISRAIADKRKLTLRLFDLPATTVDPNNCKISTTALIVSDPKNTAYFPISIISGVELDGEMGTEHVCEKV